MLQRPPNRGSDRRPPAHFKSIYAVEQFVDDLAWLVTNGEGVYAAFGEQALAPPLREAIMLSVAYENRCRYCAFMHGEWALEVGLAPDIEQELITLEPDRVSERMWAGCLYARRRTAAGFGPMSPDDRDLLRSHFTPREQYLIEVVARTMNVANRVANSFDALWTRLRGRPVPDSSLLDEATFGLVFVLAAPFGAGLLTMLTGHHPLELLSQFLKFSALFERRVADGSLASVRDLEF